MRNFPARLSAMTKPTIVPAKHIFMTLTASTSFYICLAMYIGIKIK